MIVDDPAPKGRIQSMRFNPDKEWVGENKFNSQFFGLIELCQDLRDWGVRNAQLLEIGTYKGESSIIFASTWLFDHIVTLDKYNLPEQYYPLNMFLDKMTYHFIDSKDIKEHYEDNTFDVVYIDGDHEPRGLMKDMQNARSLLKTGGYMCGHDYNKVSWPHTVDTIRGFFGREPDKVYSDTSWVYKLGE